MCSHKAIFSRLSKMGMVLEPRKCIKELHEFLYIHLNIKRFNMFHSKRKNTGQIIQFFCVHQTVVKKKKKVQLKGFGSLNTAYHLFSLI